MELKQERTNLAHLIFEQAPDDFVEKFLALEEGSLEEMNEFEILTDIEAAVSALPGEEVKRLLSTYAN